MTSSEEASPQMVLTEEQAFDLLAFLVSSAEISLIEPTHYGTFRLVDAASRLIGFMLEHNPEGSRAFLAEYKEFIDTRKVWMMWDRAAYDDFLRSAPAIVAAELKRRESVEMTADTGSRP